MKIQWLKVLFWVMLFELFFGPLRGWALDRSFKEGVLSYFKDAHTFGLYFTYLIVVFLYAICTYLALYKFYPQREYIKGIPIWIGAVLSVIFFRWFLQEVVCFNIFGVGNYNENTTWDYYLLDNLYYLIVFSFVGAIVYFIQYSKFAERERNEMIINNKKSELSFLRSQINPHFLFNSLNNLYSLVYQKSDLALETVSKLSSMLRYSLYENEEFIPLEKELNYFRDFIELERLRNSHNLKLEISIDESLFPINIAPFLLIPFVENAIKHGNLKNPEKEASIKLFKEERDLVFEVFNEKAHKEKDAVGGIGLENVKKRLQLLYPNSHYLNIHEDDSTFKISLKLKGIC